MTLHIVAIGQLPPPLHGFSHASAGMMALLAVENTIVTYNVSPPSSTNRIIRHTTKAVRVLRACMALFGERRKSDRICYLGCEGDWGLLYTLLLVACARVSGYPTYLHHHSFSYIDRPRLLMRWILAVGGHGLVHIFLCGIMQERFTAAYHSRISSRIISNAAFIPVSAESADDERGSLTIGMLSNLNQAKGLATFLTLAREAREAGLAIRVILAGPAADDGAQAMIDSAIAEFAGLLDYRGPIYDEAKAQFYRDIDVFVFPTTYANEAQPLVIFEAKAAGNALISFDRGCIRNQLDTTDLLIPVGGEFVATALAWLSDMPCGLPLRQRRQTIRHGYQHRHAAAREAALSVLKQPSP